MGLDQACRTAEANWSIIVSSSPNAQLSAVLAGFMITAIAFLLGRDERPLHAVALFAPGVLVLGLASYQFGSIAAVAPPMENGHAANGADAVCSSAWTQGMAASGMLGVGGAVLLAGLAWMMAHGADANGVDGTSLVHVGNLLVFIAVATISLLLTGTAHDYLAIMHGFGFNSPEWSIPALWTGCGIVVLLCLIIIGVRTVRFYRERADSQGMRYEENARARTVRRLPMALVVLLTALMALAAPVYCGFVAWMSSAVNNWATFIAFSLEMFLPFAIFILIALSVPGPNFAHWLKHPIADDAIAT